MAESTPDLSEVKRCIKCSQVKTADVFVRNANLCKPCKNAYQRERYRTNPAVRAKAKSIRDRKRDQHRVYMAEYNERHRKPGQRRYTARKNGEPCSVDDCGRPQKSTSLGLCAGHLRRYRASGVVGGKLRERRTVTPGTVCSISTCDEPHEALGVCRSHYLSRHYGEKLRAQSRRRRARKLSLPSEPYTLADILARDGTACVLCGEELDLNARFPERRTATVEHLECLSWPDSAGDVLSNVAASHLGCNNRRCNKPHPAAARKRAELLARTLEGPDEDAGSALAHSMPDLPH